MLEKKAATADIGSEIFLQEFEDQGLADSLHEHDAFELVYLTKGEGEWQIGAMQGRFKAGQLYVYPPGILHAWRGGVGSDPRSKVSAIVLRFRQDVLPGGLLRLPEAAPLKSLCERMRNPLFFEVSDRERLRARLRSLVRAQGVLRLARFYVALELVASFKSSQLVVVESDKETFAPRELARFERVKQLVQERFKEAVTRGEAARLVGLDEASFSRFFRRVSGTTFIDYLSNFRARHAAALLGSRRDYSIGQIAEMSGFGSLASMHRQFKKRLGTTPDSYRKAANTESLAP